MIISRGLRVAALYDIHGNLPALDAVLEEVRAAGVDRVVIGGDVMPGPMPRECLERLVALARDVPVAFIAGNGDRETLARMRGIETGGVPEAFREVIRWSGAQIPDFEQVVADWPATITVDIAGLGAVLFCHATPRNDTEVFTRRTPADRLAPIFDATGVPLVVCGHTHMQFDRTIGKTRVVNAGSVGMSFQGPGAFWLLLGSSVAPDRDAEAAVDADALATTAAATTGIATAATNAATNAGAIPNANAVANASAVPAAGALVELRRTSYDVNAAAARVRATAYPQAEDFATRNVLDPPSEATMLDAFAGIELKV